MEYSFNTNMPFDLAGVKIVLGTNSDSPKIEKVGLSLNYELLKYVGNTPLISLRERIYSEDSIFIIKDTNPKNWSKSVAYDDAREEIDKLHQ